jgi:Tol biopolymer transport system component
MTDEQLYALVRRVDVPLPPDPAFVVSSHAALAGQVRAARARDATRLGRMVRDMRQSTTFGFAPFVPAYLRVGLVLALLGLAIFLSLLVAGALTQPQPLGNGPLIVSVKGQLQVIDAATGAMKPILAAGERAEGVSRSPDGRIATFWVYKGGRSHLWRIGVDGRDRRELANGLSVIWNGSIDTWSSDSRSLATEVTLDGTARILIVDITTGAVQVVTPPRIAAHNPLWSPDDQWVAFTPETATGRGLSVIRTDGSEMHDVGGDLQGMQVSGPDTWSPDGWIYFDAGDSGESHVFRANAGGRFSQKLTGDQLHAFAAASSPDGTRLAFIASASYGFDLWVAGSDGRDPRRILPAAGLGGWSSDGQFILVRWKPPDNTQGGLATIKPDGKDLTVLIPFDESCRRGWDETCELGFGWGQARP